MADVYTDYDYEEEDGQEYADYYDYDYAQLPLAGYEDENDWAVDDGAYEEEEEEEEEGDGVGSLQLWEVYEYCVIPTLTSTLPHLTTLLVWVLVFTVTTRAVRGVPASVRHLASAVSGSCMLWQVFGGRTVYLAGQVVVGCISLAVAAVTATPSFAAPLVTIICVVYLLVCELWLVEATMWHSIRGAQMIILMKIISYSHDIVTPAPQDSHTMPLDATETIVEDANKTECNTTVIKNKVMIETSGEQRIATEKQASSKVSSTTVRNRLHPIIADTAVDEEQSSSRTCLSAADEVKTQKKRNRGSKRDSHYSNSSSSTMTGDGSKCVNPATMPDNSTINQAKTPDSIAGRAVEVVGYLLHPGTVVFGPWCSVDSYRQILQPLKLNVWLGVDVLFNFTVSILCLLCSTCFITWIIPDNSNRWVSAYRAAASFRLSHYFVSHLSEASAALGGVTVGRVASLPSVEVPRSLLGVAVAWNMPMHAFLKKYVFKRVRASAGVWCAVLSTYAASALIHGMNGQLCAVLISLALYTHAEHSLRTKLARAFDACVRAKPCAQPCTEHSHNASSPYSVLLNGCMSVLCVWHLAYLGVMFDTAPTSSSGYNISHTLNKWAKLNYASHWVVVATYIVTALI